MADVPKGHELQFKLSEYLGQYFPYVIAETSNARYDLVAYLPEAVAMSEPPAKNEELACIHRYKRVYCRAKKQEIERQARRESNEHREFKGLGGRDTLLYWKGKEYRDSGHLFIDSRKECKCDESHECELYKEQAIIIKKWNRPQLGPGLHVFEIKSDLDVPDRLTHQIPQMMEFADFVWLVLGDRFPIPDWLPPFIGVIRYDKGNWEIVRSPTGPLHSPTLYTQCLHRYGLKEADVKKVVSVLHNVKKMERAWMINSIFHFSGWQEVGHGPLVDMEPFLNWANSLRRIATEAEVVLPPEGKNVKRIDVDKKKMQTRIEAWFDDGMPSDPVGKGGRDPVGRHGRDEDDARAVHPERAPPGDGDK